MGPEKDLKLEEQLLINGQGSSGLTIKTKPINKFKMFGTTGMFTCPAFITMGVKPYLTSWINYKVHHNYAPQTGKLGD